MFHDLGVSDDIVQQLKSRKIKTPTEVQKNCIPLILDGKEVVACSQTGSGKTAAFLIPIIQNLILNTVPYFCVIITPTHELAKQIGEQAKGFLQDRSVAKTIVITGGKDYVKQGREMSQMYNILVATPGRLADLIKKNNFRNEWSLKQCKYLVLDEADRLLEDNFGADLSVIFQALNDKRKTLLFTATLTGPVLGVVDSIKKLAEENGREQPVVWRAPGMTDESTAATVETLKQYYVLSKLQNSEAIMVYVVDKFLQEHPRSLIIIFTNKCKWCQVLQMMFTTFKFKTVTLNSLMPEKDREEALGKFKSNVVRILIATDVASRGLDIPRVDLVVNHNVPLNPKSYVHRVGRTARCGRTGMSITFCNTLEMDLLKGIQTYIGRDLDMYPLDNKDLEKVSTMWKEISLARCAAERKIDGIRFKKKNKRSKESLLITNSLAVNRKSRKRKADPVSAE